MVSKKEHYLLKKMYVCIKKHGVIDRTSLQNECGRMSVTKYNGLKSYFEEEYEGRVRYERERKIWIDLHPDTPDMEQNIQKILTHYQ